MLTTQPLLTPVDLPAETPLDLAAMVHVLRSAGLMESAFIEVLSGPEAMQATMH